MNNVNEKNILNILLEGMGLSSFTFHTSFQIRFSREKEIKFKDKELPIEINLSILTNWWFGDRNEWDKFVDRLTADFKFVEPDEPVLAFKLTALRWMDGSIISCVNLSSDKLELKFECGESMTILNSNEMDYAWEISECNIKDSNDSWSIICEDREIFYNLTNILTTSNRR